MYDDLPVTGIGAAVLAVAGVAMFAIRAVARIFGQR